MAVFLPEQLAAWTGGRWLGRPGPLTAVTQDTRRLTPGALYVALRGERFDGHAFAGEALRAGAAAAMVRADFAATSSARPLLAVPDTARALLDLARGHRARLGGRFVAVTGSLGKTTVKEMLLQVLGADAPVAGTHANWNNAIGVPLSLLAMDPGAAYGVFEAGMSHPGELAPLLALIRPHWGVMTRIAPVHMAFFDREEAVAREKAELVRALPPDGTAVLAADEPWFALLRGAAACRVVTVALAGGPVSEAANYLGTRAADDPGALEVAEPSGRRHRYPMPQPGEPTRRNAMRAIAVALEYGVAPERIAERLRDFRAPPMRWETVAAAGVRWINDAYNASPVSMRAALETFAGLDGAERRWVVLGGMHEMGEDGAEAHRALGRVVAGGPWAGLVAVGDLAGDIADGAREAGWAEDRIVRAAGPEEAAARLERMLAPGDAVLLKASRRERLEAVLAAWRRLVNG